MDSHLIWEDMQKLVDASCHLNWDTRLHLMKQARGRGLESYCLVVLFQPNLPTCVKCLMCNQVNTEDNPLMECRFCGEIVHPPCLKDIKGLCKIVTEINNCWECPKCCKDATVSTDFKVCKLRVG